MDGRAERRGTAYPSMSMTSFIGCARPLNQDFGNRDRPRVGQPTSGPSVRRFVRLSRPCRDRGRPLGKKYYAPDI